MSLVILNMVSSNKRAEVAVSFTCPLKGHDPNDLNVFLHLSLAILFGVQLLHPVGIAEGVQGVLARRHAGADHCDHTRSRLRVEDDALR